MGGTCSRSRFVGDGTRSNFPARFQAATLPGHANAVVSASRASRIVDGSDNLERLRSVRDMPGPLRAVMNVPTYTLLGTSA